MCTRNFSCYMLILFFACPLWGQVKKALTEEDYNLWHTLHLQQLSENGKWVSYSVNYAEGTDTLFVKNTMTLKTSSFAGKGSGQFLNNSNFLFRGNNNTLTNLNLETNITVEYFDIQRYSIVKEGQYIVMLQKYNDMKANLLVCASDGTEIISVPEVSQYAISPNNKLIVCNSKGTIQLMKLGKQFAVTTLDSVRRNYSHFAWQSTSESFSFKTDDLIAYYKIPEGKMYSLTKNQISDKISLDGDFSLSDLGHLVSNDGAKVFFTIRSDLANESNTGIQIWNTEDKVLYLNRIATAGFENKNFVAVWFPQEQRIRLVTDISLPNYILLPNENYALVYNPLTNEPQFDRDAPLDYYLHDVNTGRNELLLSQQSADGNKLAISSTGKYIAYFKNGQWWLYDTTTNSHRNLSSRIDTSFVDKNYDRSGEVKVCGIAGWTANDQDVLVYDNNDIWLFKTDGTDVKRLTNGREEGIIYRVALKSPFGPEGFMKDNILDLSEGLLLHMENTSKTGYCKWTSKSGKKLIVLDSNRVGELVTSKNGNVCYLSEHYHLPPQLVFKPADRKPTILFQSNQQQKNYQWGFSKLITYEISNGEVLQGALFYPAGYQAEKKYPMVVHVYELQSKLFNQYVNPTLINSEGFNISNFTSSGYFVLLPDISYIEGKPGGSAVDCVLNAVEEVVRNESVDQHRIGLIGHSFGGYETNFIITQTNKFAAAISGAGVSNIVSGYLSIGKGNKKADYWRYEFSQFRMGQSLFDAHSNYIQNSPITFAAQIETPLLLWSGKQDASILFTQSQEFHMALRRLKKENILLLYENAGHSVLNKDKQVHLTHAIQEWFAYYLKKVERPAWISPNQP
jgi:dipeptidyl aminopeptidase/acylaminoacyl peptidase